MANSYGTLTDTITVMTTVRVEKNPENDNKVEVFMQTYVVCRCPLIATNFLTCRVSSGTVGGKKFDEWDPQGFKDMYSKQLVKFARAAYLESQRELNR